MKPGERLHVVAPAPEDAELRVFAGLGGARRLEPSFDRRDSRRRRTVRRPYLRPAEAVLGLRYASRSGDVSAPRHSRYETKSWSVCNSPTHQGRRFERRWIGSPEHDWTDVQRRKATRRFSETVLSPSHLCYLDEATSYHQSGRRGFTLRPHRNLRNHRVQHRPSHGAQAVPRPPLALTSRRHGSVLH